MKRTPNINDAVMQHAREEAAPRRTAMSALVEARLRRGPEPPRKEGADALPPLPAWRSGGFRVDPADRNALYRPMEEDG